MCSRTDGRPVARDRVRTMGAPVDSDRGSRPRQVTARKDLTEAQRATVRQLEEEKVFGSSRVVDIASGCGWARIEDSRRDLVATIDRAGTLLGLEGRDRPSKSTSR